MKEILRKRYNSYPNEKLVDIVDKGEPVYTNTAITVALEVLEKRKAKGDEWKLNKKDSIKKIESNSRLKVTEPTTQRRKSKKTGLVKGRIYRISEDKTIDLAIKKAKSTVLLWSIPSVILILIAAFSMQGSKNIFESLFYVILMAIGFLLYMGIVRIIQNVNYYESLSFEIGINNIKKIISKENLNLGNKYAISKGERKFGAKPNQTILFSDITSIEIKEEEIKIYAMDSNFLNNNGIITMWSPTATIKINQNI